MAQFLRCLVFASALLAGVPANGQGPSAAAHQSSPFTATNPTLQASLARIARQSSLWRDAATTIARAGRRAVILTSEQVVAATPGAPGRLDPAVLAEVTPLVRDEIYVDVVLVVVNLTLLDEQYRGQLLPPIEFERDLDRILVHEIYGHAVPYLLAGDLSGRCADPERRQPASEACSIRRENAVRAELGLGRRLDYGLDGLSLARRAR
jgi:hypothetical protein